MTDAFHTVMCTSCLLGISQVKDMEQGTEEVVSISELPSHVAKLVQGIGKRTLVATKRQMPASDQAALATPEQAGSRQQDASAGQPPASSTQAQSPQKGQAGQQAKQGKQSKQSKQSKEGKQRDDTASNTGGGVQDGALAS